MILILYIITTTLLTHTFHIAAKTWEAAKYSQEVYNPVVSHCQAEKNRLAFYSVKLSSEQLKSFSTQSIWVCLC